MPPFDTILLLVEIAALAVALIVLTVLSMPLILGWLQRWFNWFASGD